MESIFAMTSMHFVHGTASNIYSSEWLTSSCSALDNVGVDNDQRRSDADGAVDEA